MDQTPLHEGAQTDAEQFRLLVQAVTDYAIYMLDATGPGSSWNTSTKRIKGYTSRRESLTSNFSPVIHRRGNRATGEPAKALQHRGHGKARFEKEGLARSQGRHAFLGACGDRPDPRRPMARSSASPRSPRHHPNGNERQRRSWSWPAGPCSSRREAGRHRPALRRHRPRLQKPADGRAGRPGTAAKTPAARSQDATALLGQRRAGRSSTGAALTCSGCWPSPASRSSQV